MVRHIFEDASGERIQRIDQRTGVVRYRHATLETTVDVVEYPDGSHAIKFGATGYYVDQRSLDNLWVRDPYNPSRTRGLQLPGGLEVYLKYDG
jgi:hypothetical protein